MRNSQCYRKKKVFLEINNWIPIGHEDIPYHKWAYEGLKTMSLLSDKFCNISVYFLIL